MEKPSAIVLAAFGASQEQALSGIMNVKAMAEKEFSGNVVRLAFTSNMLRRIWRQRSQNRAWLEENPEVPRDVLEVRNTLAAVADLQDQGYRDIVVQPLHIYAGEEYADLASYIEGLRSIRTLKEKWRPFNRLALGRPALGRPGPEHPYLEDIKRAVRALADDARLAVEMDATLVYLGHGNEYFSTGVYMELQQLMRESHSRANTVVGTVEGAQGIDYVIDQLAKAGTAKVLLKPLMLVAGEHAREDMCGAGPESWKSILEARGVEVHCRLEGLGEKKNWAEIYLANIKDAAAMAGIDLEGGHG